MTKLFFLFAALSLLVSLQASSQEDKRPTSAHASNIFLELGGNAGVISLNYDRRFGNRDNGFGGRIGIGFGMVPNHMFGDAVATVPVAINYLAGTGPHYLEAGAGVTFGEERFGGGYFEERRQVHFVPSLGYRLQRLTKGFTFRAFFSPHITKTIRLSGGISLGLRF